MIGLLDELNQHLLRLFLQYFGIRARILGNWDVGQRGTHDSDRLGRSKNGTLFDIPRKEKSADALRPYAYCQQKKRVTDK